MAIISKKRYPQKNKAFRNLSYPKIKRDDFSQSVSL